MSETLVRVESVRIPKYRRSYGSCLDLALSIDDEGLRHPITLWKDGTLISGGRRLFAHILHERERIPAVFVNTIEDAAKRLHADNQDTYLAEPMVWSEIGNLWHRLRLLDAPAAVKRADEARRRGVELRRQTQAGNRHPGRSVNRSEDYVLHVICAPFGYSYATCRRVETIWLAANAEQDSPDRDLARALLGQIDQGAPVWPAYKQLKGIENSPNQTVPPPPAPRVPAAAAKQLTAWDRVLPALEGLVVGLTELGPPNPALTWDQVGPVRTRLMASRRAMEQIIKQMKPKENTQS